MENSKSRRKASRSSSRPCMKISIRQGGVQPAALWSGPMLLTSLSIDHDELAARTGWDIKPEGACREDVCVPLPESARNPDGTIDARVLSECLGMPLVGDDSHDSRRLWALGPAARPTSR